MDMAVRKIPVDLAYDLNKDGQVTSADGVAYLKGARPDTSVIPGTDTGTQPGTLPGTDTGTQPGTDTGTQPGTGTDTGVQPGTGTQPGTDTGVQPGTDTGVQPDTGTQPGTDTGTQPGTDTGVQPDTGTQPDTGVQPDTDIQPDTGTQPDTGVQPDTQPDTKPDTLPDTQPDTKPDTLPDPQPGTDEKPPEEEEKPPEEEQPPPPPPPEEELEPEETEEEKAKKAAAAARAAQAAQARQAALLSGVTSFLAPRKGAGADDTDEFGPFKPITTGGPSQEFKGPLQEFLQKVEGQSYTGQDPFMAPEGQKTQPPKMDMNAQQSPNYFNYGKPTEIDDTLNVTRGINAELSALMNPLGSVWNPMSGSTFAEGGLATPLFNQGGATRYGRYAGGGLNVVHHSGKARVDFREGDAVTGPGDGQSDDIPAMLADGEFVFPADVVAALGNGSTKAGSDKLYDMMHSIRAHARSTGPKDLPPPAKASPLDYLKSPKKGAKDRKDRR
jgi:hypothetical protein